MENIAARLKKKAKRDKVRLILGATIMMVLIISLKYIIVDSIGNKAVALITLTFIIIAIFACALFFLLRLVKNMEADSFDEGMNMIIESIPTAAILFDKDGKLKYCNKKAPKLFGFNNKEEYEDNYTSTIPEFQPDGRRTEEKEAEHIDNLLKEGNHKFEWMYQTFKGEPLPAKVRLIRLNFQGEPHILEFTEDLREMYENQKREKELKEKQQAILDFAPIMCALFDEQYNTLDVNNAVGTMLETTKQTYIDHFTDFIPKYQPDGSESLAKSCELIKTAFETGSHRYEYTYQTRDGRPVPVEETATRVTIGGKNVVICYTRDLREFYKNREKDNLMQQNIKSMSEELNAHVSEQAVAVTQSSNAIEKMIASIQSVTNTLHKNAESVKELQEASEIGHTGLSGVAADIQEITRESESLMEINSVIQSIASQTNLLSMNAAIEAAHAGESGKGFAVVADEIRKLAESSSAQSKTISTVLKKIKTSIDTITKSIEDVLRNFEAIGEGVKTVAEQDKNILNAMEEQGQESKQIRQAVERVNELTQGIKAESNQMVESSRKALKGN